MRLQTSTLSRVINFLLGVAWASLLLGAFYIFLSYYRFSLVDAIFLSFLGSLPGLFFVVVLEYLIVGLQQYEETKKQTKLLEELLEQTKKRDIEKNDILRD